MECLITRKHTLKMLCKFKHFPRRKKENVIGCFFLKSCAAVDNPSRIHP